MSELYFAICNTLPALSKCPGLQTLSDQEPYKLRPDPGRPGPVLHDALPVSSFRIPDYAIALHAAKVLDSNHISQGGICSQTNASIYAAESARRLHLHHRMYTRTWCVLIVHVAIVQVHNFDGYILQAPRLRLIGIDYSRSYIIFSHQVLSPRPGLRACISPP